MQKWFEVLSNILVELRRLNAHYDVQKEIAAQSQRKYDDQLGNFKTLLNSFTKLKKNGD